MFFCEICEIFKSRFFYRRPPMAASGNKYALCSKLKWSVRFAYSNMLALMPEESFYELEDFASVNHFHIFLLIWKDHSKDLNYFKDTVLMLKI